MPLHSMTGFGTASSTHEGTRYGCEIRSLNSRYLEINVRLPRFLIRLEPKIHQHIRSKLGRGKVDLFLQVDSPEGSRVIPRINLAVVREYINHFTTLKSITKDEGRSSPSPMELLRLDGVIETQEPLGLAADSEDTDPWLVPLIDTAIKSLTEMRAREGRDLEQTLLGLCQQLCKQSSEIQSLLPGVQVKMQARFREQIQKISETFAGISGASGAKPPSEERLLQEAIILAEKSDIQEEIDRLEIHLKAFAAECKKSGQIGRRLDFLCQELHREINTMGSKVDDQVMTGHFITMKQNVEQMRQQVQNIE